MCMARGGNWDRDGSGDGCVRGGAACQGGERNSLHLGVTKHESKGGSRGAGARHV